MADDGIEHVYVFATSAYASFSGCRQYHEDIARARVASGGGPDRGEAAALLRRPGLRAGQRRRARRRARRRCPTDVRDTARLVATAHSIPDAMAAVAGPDGGAYEAELTAAARAGRGRGRAGPARSTWCGRAAAGRRPCRGWSPTSTTTCGRWPRPGRPPSSSSRSGFISDHLEVIWDLDNEAKETAAELGLAFARAGTAGTHPAFVAVDPASCWRSAGPGAAPAGHQLPGALLLRRRPRGRRLADVPPDRRDLAGCTGGRTPSPSTVDDRRRHASSSGRPGRRRSSRR